MPGGRGGGGIYYNMQIPCTDNHTHSHNQYILLLRPGGHFSMGQLCPGGRGQLCPAGRGQLCPRSHLSMGQLCPGGHFSRGQLCPGGHLSMGQLCPGGHWSRGQLCPGDHRSMGQLCPGDYFSRRQLCPGGHFSRGQLCPGGHWSRGHIPYYTDGPKKNRAISDRCITRPQARPIVPTLSIQLVSATRAKALACFLYGGLGSPQMVATPCVRLHAEHNE